MIVLEPLRWVLTLAFAGVASFHLVRPVVGHGHDHPVSDVLHAAMAVAMVVMMGPSGSAVPQAVWLVLFAAATTWFLIRAVPRRAGRVTAVFSASAMAAMVWMAAGMPGSMPGMVMSPREGWAGGLVGGYFVAASLVWVVRGMRLGGFGSRPEPPDWPSVCHGVMSAGMGLATLAII